MSDVSNPVFGIDLGTTYSAIAYLDETGRATVCRNDDNAETMPSVVHFESVDNVVVGETAKQTAVLDPENVVSLIKRQMGRKFDLSFHGTDHTPESISALILRRLAVDAAAYTGGEVIQAVITVPAYFGLEEKQATRNAGRIAGLDVVGVLPEPVAAAVHYDLTADSGDKTVLVYDLGGGTFDTTVIDVRGDDITVLVTDGDTNLGGADWDARLRDHVLDRFVAETAPEVDPHDDPDFLQDVANRVEVLKKQLSQQESRPIVLKLAGVGTKLDVTRADFESMTADLMDRSVAVVRRTLKALEDKAPGRTIDQVLLVGGSTLMPMVTARLAAEFGWSPKLHDPHLAVAKGAALWGVSKIIFRDQQEARKDAADATDAERRADEVLTSAANDTGISKDALSKITAKQTVSVLPKAFGIKLQDQHDANRDYVEHLAFANDALPITGRRLTAGTTVDNQEQVRIAVYEQAGTVPGPDLESNNPVLNGDDVIHGIPPRPAGEVKIEIDLGVNEDGLLTVTAVEAITGQKLTIRVTVGLSEQEVEQASRTVSAITVSS